MKVISYILLFLTFFTLNISITFSQCPVVINEIMVTPVGDAYVNSFFNIDTLSGGNPSIGAEWIELYNTNPCDTADISCFILACNQSPDSTYVNWGAKVIPGGTFIPPLGHLVIGGEGVPDADLFFYISNSNFCSSKRWFLNDSAGWICLYNSGSQPVDAVYWNLNGTSSDLFNIGEYGNNLTVNPFLCTCCSSSLLVCAKNIPGAEYAGNVVLNSSITLSRQTDGSPVWTLGPVNGTPKACNAGVDSCYAWDATISTVSPTCVDGNDGSASVTVNTIGYPQSPFTYQWSNGQTTQVANNLTDGTYTVTVFDKWGCQYITSTTLNDPIPPAVSVTSNNNPVCQGDDLILSCNIAGVSYAWTGPSGYSSSSANPVVQNFQSGNVGTYSLDIIDPNGCPFTAETQVSISLLPVFSLGYDTTICDLQNLIYNVENTGTFTYLWSNGSVFPANSVYSSGSGVPAQNPFWAWVSVSGCKTLTDSVQVYIKHCEIEIPNVITPNNDNINDFFVIKWIELFPNNRLIIFNRWGKKVFESTNYQDNWDGDNNPDGVYFYILNAPDGTPEGITIQGTVTILRNK